MPHNGVVTEDVLDVQRTLDLALRVGEQLLSNGAGAADVTATMSAISYHLGLRQVLVDVTFTTLTLNHQTSAEEPVVTMRRNITYRENDYADLTDLDHLVSDLLAGRIDREEAARRVARVTSSGHRTPRWAITLGWAFSGAGIALLLSSDPIVMAIAAVAAAGIEVLQRWLGRYRLPIFYLQVAGALWASLLAVAVAATPIPVNPSLVISTSIIMLLAGLGFIGAMQDALTGYYITANARLLEVMIATVGVIVGVGVGLSVGGWLGVDLAVVPGETYLRDVVWVSLGAGAAALGFAFIAYSPTRVLVPVGLVGAAAGGLSFVTVQQGLGQAPAAALAAIAIGLVSYGIAGRFRVPPLVIVVPSIVPLLPGLSIYRALSMLADENSSGVVAMITAAGIAIALSSGVLLGEYIAQPLRREARRLETRLAGPRLVGPLKLRPSRRPRSGRSGGPSRPRGSTGPTGPRTSRPAGAPRRRASPKTGTSPPG